VTDVYREIAYGPDVDLDEEDAPDVDVLPLQAAVIVSAAPSASVAPSPIGRC
jgi:hypothetical protein